MSKLLELFPELDAYVVLKDLGAGEIIENGDELVHSCMLPFGLHKNGDSNPSASLNRETLLFNCFTCGGGSIIWLAQNRLEVSKEEAVSWLKGYTSIRYIPIEEFEDRLKKLFSEEKEQAVDIPTYNKRIVERLACVSDYLLERGVTEEVQKAMGTGLETKMEINKEGSIVDVTRVVIPHYMNGKLIGWVARKTEDVPGVAKYRNSKGFPRNYWLYNLDNCLGMESVFVVESPMSVLILKSRGVNNVVATFGAKVSKPQLRLLRQFNEVVIFMDGDSPGRAAKKNLMSGLMDFTKVMVVDTPDGEDPGSLKDIPYYISGFEYQLKRT